MGTALLHLLLSHLLLMLNRVRAVVAERTRPAQRALGLRQSVRFAAGCWRGRAALGVPRAASAVPSSAATLLLAVALALSQRLTRVIDGAP